jgi:hypothetical protein
MARAFVRQYFRVHGGSEARGDGLGNARRELFIETGGILWTHLILRHAAQ